MSEALGGHEQYGIVALSNVDDYGANRIKKHELTTLDKEEDRTRLCDVQGANAGPVFLAFQGAEEIQVKIQEWIMGEPYGHVVSDDGFSHTLWKIPVEDSLELSKAFEDIECTYVADGHHRTAAAYNVGEL